MDVPDGWYVCRCARCKVTPILSIDPLNQEMRLCQNCAYHMGWVNER